MSPFHLHRGLETEYLNQEYNLENRFVVAKGEGEFVISRCKLSYREGKNSKVLLYNIAQRTIFKIL